MAELTLTPGASAIRKDAWTKVTGAAEYVDDLALPGVRIGRLVRSPHHHARIVGIDARQARALPGVLAILTAADIPGEKTFGPLVADQPPLAQGVVRHLGEPVALVIAEDVAAALRGVEAVRVEYEPLRAVFDASEAIKPGAPMIHPGANLVTRYEMSSGDVVAGFAEADVILEQVFEVPRIAPSYMEPEAALARWNEDKTLTVWVSSQQPFVDRHHIACVLGLPEERVHVVSAVVGGAFGGKEDSSLQILAALGAWATRGTVRLVNNRHESFLAHPKRHPARLFCKIGAKHDGTLVALETRVHLDTGAYASYGPAVGSLLTEMVPGAYRIPNVRVETQVIYTNCPYSGAMRGFGSPQAHFAIESLLDMLAARLEIDPLALRRQNALREGDRLASQVEVQHMADSLTPILEQAEAARARLRQIAAGPGRAAGVGVALAMQSMGLGYRVPDDSTNRLRLRPDGRVRLEVGAAELGQGLWTAAEQVAADALGLPYDAVQADTLDTATSPDGGVTCASRMTYVVGNSVARAAEQLIVAVLDYAAGTLGVPSEDLRYERGQIITPGGEALPLAEFASRAADDGVDLVGEATFSFPYPEDTPAHLPVGMPHVRVVFGAQVARVELDPELGTVRVTDLVAIHDVGRAINRAGVEGQIEGAVAQGIGYALYENVRLKPDGRWVDSFTEYLIPTAEDMPTRLETVILEIATPGEPLGIKGVGEMGLVPTAPAIANAVYDATGVRVTALPITADKLVSA